MDVELLIAKVCARQPVWNRRNKYHANRNVVDRLWAEISQEMNCDESVAKRKWKYLRDQYAVELGKIPDDSSTSKWRYFKLLNFLKDVVKPRTSLGARKRSKIDDYSMEDDETPRLPVGVSKRPKTDEYSQSNMDIDRQKLQYLKEKADRKQDEEEEDLMFFKSLLPHVQRIPAAQKLTFRSSLQELVQQFAYPLSGHPSHPDIHDNSSSD